MRVSGRGPEGGAHGIERDMFGAGSCCELGVASRESGRGFAGRDTCRLSGTCFRGVALTEEWADPCGVGHVGD